jgi:hypothetical protein
MRIEKQGQSCFPNSSFFDKILFPVFPKKLALWYAFFGQKYFLRKNENFWLKTVFEPAVVQALSIFETAQKAV